MDLLQVVMDFNERYSISYNKFYAKLDRSYNSYKAKPIWGERQKPYDIRQTSSA